jgi:hypothetical protein
MSSTLLALLRCELQLRSRRAATLVAVLAVLAVTWLMLVDPAGGHALMVVDDQRLRYSSGTLAFGSAGMGALLFSLAGFYLCRGRVQEDLRSGVAGVLAATPVSSRLLLLARWLGGVAYLLLLAGALLIGTWALHLLRGEGPLQPLVYLQTYALMLLPPLLASAAFATLFDAWAPLMGRKGDVAYFFLWVAMLGTMPLHEPAPDAQLAASMLLDQSGLATGVTRLAQLMGSGNVSIGGGDFKAGLALLEFPAGFWTGELVLLRLGACLFALPPLLLALKLFHRYAPDKVRARAAGRQNLLLRVANRLLQPATRVLAALLPLVARLPQGAAAVIAELLLSLISQPLALIWLLVAWLGPLAAEPAELWGWQAAIAFGWGLWASELGARDAQANTAALVAALPGGTLRAFWSRWAAALGLGLLANATLMARAPETMPALLVGLALLSALSLLLGRLTQGGRTFLALFMAWMLMAVQVRRVAWIDLIGFNGQLQGLPLGALAITALVLMAVGLAIARRR